LPVVYPEEGHAFRAPANVKDFWSRIDAFLAQHMAARTSA
jgi:dipeptidyl aminopeptidase/acylaminoacyl peptidase